MAQFVVENLEGASGNISFLIREVNETNGNRFLSFNPISRVVIFNEIQDNLLHNYSVTINAEGCQGATRIIPFQCSAVGACDPVHNGVIESSGNYVANVPIQFYVTNLYGSTPYTYNWEAVGAVVSSTSTSSTHITFPDLGTYIVKVTVNNCGTSPVILEKEVIIQSLVCNKTTNVCYFYGMNGVSPYSTLNAAQSAACVDTPVYTHGSFTNGLNVGSTIYSNTNPDSCSKLFPGFYPIKVSSNNCASGSVASSLFFSIIQVDIEGKIVTQIPFICDVDFTLVSTQQPLCISNALSDATVTLSGIVNANSYVLCQGASFNCSMDIPTGSILASTAAISVPAPPAGTTQVYVLRLYNSSNFNKFKDQNISITSPAGCNSPTPVPILMGAEVQTSNTITLRGISPCVGELKVYGRNPGTLDYELVYTGDVSTQQFAVNFPWSIPNEELVGREIVVTLNCPVYGVVSDYSDPTISYMAP